MTLVHQNNVLTWPEPRPCLCATVTAEILKYNDTDGEPMVTKILDQAGQKGTGKWTAINALDMGMPVTLIGEAVFARCLSALKEERGRASKNIPGPAKEAFKGDKQQFM